MKPISTKGMGPGPERNPLEILVQGWIKEQMQDFSPPLSLTMFYDK